MQNKSVFLKAKYNHLLFTRTTQMVLLILIYIAILHQSMSCHNLNNDLEHFYVFSVPTHRQQTTYKYLEGRLEGLYSNIIIIIIKRCSIIIKENGMRNFNWVFYLWWNDQNFINAKHGKEFLVVHYQNVCLNALWKTKPIVRMCLHYNINSRIAMKIYLYIVQ